MLKGVTKRGLQRYLYEFRVQLGYRKVAAVVRGAVADDPAAFRGVPAASVLAIKRALEAYRTQEGVTSGEAVEAEAALLEKAAELGDNSAVALLVGARLSEPKVTPEDWRDGSNLLRQLMDAKFPLAFKVAGDLAYRMARPLDAANFYKRAVDAGLADNKLRTECLRSLGHIYFKESRLFEARRFFSLACRDAHDPRQVADCHFFLAQLREANREASRAHLEAAAAAGLSDAFVPLGMALLNVFGDAALAREWLQLGLVTDKTGQAAVGLLDAARRLGDDKLARSALERIRRLENADALLGARSEAVRALDRAEAGANGLPQVGHGPAKDPQAPQQAPHAPAAATVSAEPTRWDF